MASRSITVTSMQEPAPVLRLRLTKPQKILWKEMAEKCKEISPDEILHVLEAEQKKILDDATDRGDNCITTNESDALNWATKKGIEIIIDKFKKDALKILLLSPNDSPEVLKAKVELGKGFVSWIQDFVQWLERQMGAPDLCTAGKDNPNPDRDQLTRLNNGRGQSDTSVPPQTNPGNGNGGGVKVPSVDERLKAIWEKMTSAINSPLNSIK